MFISKFSTESWQGNQNKIVVHLAQNWKETAIRELDGDHKTLVTLETNDEAHMSIGGGLGKYIVYVRKSQKTSIKNCFYVATMCAPFGEDVGICIESVRKCPLQV